MIVVLALLSAIWLFASEATRLHRSPVKDPTSEFIGRFDVMRNELPSHGVVGYIADDAREADQRYMEFHLVQYALSPVIIVLGTDRELVVGNFPDPAAGRGISESKKLTVLKDLGGGVMLLRGKAEQ